MGNYLTVDLGGKVKVKALGGREVEISEVEVYEMVDNPVKKTVWAICRNHPTRVLLWEKEGYDAAGQWTDADVVNRIKEIYKA